MAALCDRISVGLLEGAEELFSAAQYPMDCALDAGAVPESSRCCWSSACGDTGSRQRSAFSRNEDPFPAEHWHGLRLPAGHGGPLQQAGALGICVSRSCGLHTGTADFDDGSGAGVGSFLS